MSRQTKFELLLSTGIKCQISLHKSFEAATGFSRGKDGRPVRMINVIAVDDATPKTKDDIESVVPWDEIETYYSYRDAETGETKLMPIDKKALQAMFKNSNAMQMIGILNTSAIKPHMFDDAHYFVNVQRDSKTKTVLGPDQKVYSIIYQYLLDMDKYMLVKFISNSREKFAVIYADPLSAGLRMSILIHSTYQRERDMSCLCEIPSALDLGKRLLKDKLMRSLAEDMIRDDYEEKLRSYIEKMKEGDPEPGKIMVSLKPRTTEIDILDLIAAMPS